MSVHGLIHLIYASAAVGNFEGAALNAMLHASRVANAKRSVSGMLLYSAGSFFQVLEGDESTVEALYQRIAVDPRHDRVTRIIAEPIAQRSFEQWTMGFVELDPAEIEGVDGLSDFFREGQSLISLPPGRARNLLSAFGAGRWRARLRASE